MLFRLLNVFHILTNFRLYVFTDRISKLSGCHNIQYVRDVKQFCKGSFDFKIYVVINSPVK